MNRFCLIPALACVVVMGKAVAAVAPLPPSGPIPDDEKTDIISTLRVVRLTADQETRDCVAADKIETARQLTRISMEIIQLNLAIRTKGYTYEELTDRLANQVRPIETELLLQPNAGACEPSRVIEQIEAVLGTSAVFWAFPLNPRTPPENPR
ncbi:hypothetical protein WME90_23435 [Sorangium sp. So ce375]|uniref:hypothetical protein n=1 Tax=Sorangium sp. So ce375 TaxID=3133306 RepID=UPI003F5B5658